MKTFVATLFASAVMASEWKSHEDFMVQPYWAPKDDSENAKKFWNGDLAAYRAAVDDSDSNNCKIYESHNFFGAQQCKQSWECRGARTCERGGWCSGYDGCAETPLPEQAPGLLPDH